MPLSFSSTSARGTSGLSLRAGIGINRHLLLVLALALVLHDAVDGGKEGEVATQLHVDAGVNHGAELANEDAARRDLLAPVDLHAAPLRIAVTTVAGRA